MHNQRTNPCIILIHCIHLREQRIISTRSRHGMRIKARMHEMRFMGIYTFLIPLLLFVFCLISCSALVMATDDQAVVGADVFDHIDDFLNFSCDDAIDDFPDGHTVAAAAASDFPVLVDPLNAGDGLFGVDAVSDGIEVPKLGSLEELDIGSADLDWVSHFLDDSAYFSLDLPTIPSTVTAKNNGSSSNKEVSPFRTSSPVSVLEPNTLGGSGGSSSSYSIATTTTATATSSSSSSSSSGFGGGSGSSNIVASNPMPPICPPEAVVIPGRARTKRPRPSSFSPRTHVTIPFVPPTSEPAAPIQSDPESFGEYDPSPMMMMTKKKKKKSMPVAAVGDEEAGSPPVRKCMHCQITKTPQWRAGPMGPKTLCNACGVRYKSGRLFPEYRPAASPTFVPSIHSNSHKKVVEMRIKAGQRSAVPLPDNPAAKGCDLLQFIRRRD